MLFLPSPGPRSAFRGSGTLGWIGASQICRLQARWAPYLSLVIFLLHAHCHPLRRQYLRVSGPLSILKASRQNRQFSAPVGNRTQGEGRDQGLGPFVSVMGPLKRSEGGYGASLQNAPPPESRQFRFPITSLALQGPMGLRI